MFALVSEEPLFGVVFAFVDSKLPLRFNAASLARVLALYQGRKLKERAFRAKGTQVFLASCSYLVIIRLNTGTAIAIITAPNTISTMRSVDICGIPAPSTMTLLSESEA